MTENRSIKNIKKLEFEDTSEKRIVPKEMFATKVIQYLCNTKYFYASTLIGTIDYVSHKYMIYCKEAYCNIYYYLVKELQEVGMVYSNS